MSDSDFAKRLAVACDNHELVPAYGFGRQTWLKERMKVSHEAVRKWVKGESRPRPKTMRRLAELLDVDEAWLSLGIEPEATPRERIERGTRLAGAAGVFMGLLQVNGGQVATPDPVDPLVDCHAIIESRLLAFHVSLAHKTSPDQVAFNIPLGYERCIVVGAIRVAPLCLEFVTLPTAVITQYGINHGGHIELLVEPRKGHYVVNSEKMSRLQSFEDFLTAA